MSAQPTAAGRTRNRAVTARLPASPADSDSDSEAAGWPAGPNLKINLQVTVARGGASRGITVGGPAPARTLPG